ncbi:MAG: twin-arginine translocase TatA/TatE family subunit [Chthoniobacteraceae bacterium]
MNTIATLVSGQDMLFIFLIVLVLFGAKKLPELAKGMGQAVREFNKAKDEIEREISKPVNELTVQPAPDKLEHNPAVSVAATEPVSPAASPTAPRV